MTEKKHKDFVKELMKDKPIEMLAGIENEETILKFNEMGYTKAYNVLGQFLSCARNCEMFEYWLTLYVPCMSPENRIVLIYCLEDWCSHHLV